MSKEAKTRVASFIILIRDNQIFLVQRGNTGWRDGDWALPAGKVDEGESFHTAAVRELTEETGVIAQPEDVRFAIMQHRAPDDLPNATAWVDVYFVCEKWQGEPTNSEPHKHSDAGWFPLDDLPDNLIECHPGAIQAWQNGESYREYEWGI